MSERVVLVSLSHGGSIITSLPLAEVDSVMLEYSHHDANGYIVLPLLNGNDEARLFPRHVVDWVEIDRPEAGEKITVEERESGAKVTMRSGMRQIAADFQDDETLITDLLVKFTEEVLEKALVARRSL